MGKGGKYLAKKPVTQKKKKSVISKILIGILIVLLLIIGSVVLYINHLMNLVSRPDDVVMPTSVTAAPTQELPATEAEETTVGTTSPEDTWPEIISDENITNFMLVGQAARNDATERFADTMILCTLNTYEKTLTLTSILRDSFIGNSGPYNNHYWGNIKITTVYHLGYMWGGTAGSMACMNQTLYDNFGIEVDHNFEVDFEAFATAINLLGGVELELTQAEADYLNEDDLWVRYDVEPGLQKLDGMAALSYARMRKADGDNESDVRRTSRQRYLMTVLLDKAKKMSITDLQKMADKVLPYVTTSMDTAEITELLLKVLPMLPELEIRAEGTCPAEYSGGMVDIYKDGMEHSVLKFNPYETKKTMRAITEGENAE